MKSKKQVFILVVLFAFTFLMIGSMTILEEYFYATRPRLPTPEKGRIYSQDVKSLRGVSTVYLTRYEKLPFQYVQFANPMLCIVGIVVLYFISTGLKKS